MAELLPCPFCGNNNVSIVTDNLEHSLGIVDTDDFQIICSKSSCGCEATSGKYSDPDEAVDAWNTRTPKERGGEK